MKELKDYNIPEEIMMSCRNLGIIRPTEIQQKILENLHEKRDILAVSGTGTGKTLAYAIPILTNLLKADRYFYALILLPTRELAQQVHSLFQELGKEISLRVSLLIGGVDLLPQAKSLSARPHVIIGTPGRVSYHVKHTKGIHLDAFNYVVLDECDRLLDGDFEGEVKEILNSVEQRNTFLFTATLSKRVTSLKTKILNNPLFFHVTEHLSTPSALLQNYIFLPQKYKDVYLCDIISKMGPIKTIVFVSTCVSAEKLEMLLLRMGELVCSVHGNKQQHERSSIIEGFRTGAQNILIATDVLARGIDIPSVRTIINYDVPECAKDYIHRVGRTARAGASGRSITFVTQYDVEEFQRLEISAKCKMQEYHVDKESIEQLMDVVMEAKRDVEIDVKSQKESQKASRTSRTSRARNAPRNTARSRTSHARKR
ncbi:ATP-dependent RNA helicase DDX47/RRP3 [Nematocida sp. LUAm3]|nr:ATP-dependent RNA helicase DDX47/RRP3 [Nematocida sp. LUAm3]KAI5174565.1 ATP-dependent RNA helicase DDX47/RRP3 [Nematocida sp. LUAm2]KAI5178029.1 ATP-dependent RNA helicase DDX47/RRP3 [Nematocida sp. LUAm1]